MENTEKFIEGFEIVSKIKNEYAPIKLKHIACQEVFLVSPKLIDENLECPSCDLFLRGLEIYLNDIEREYNFLSETYGISKLTDIVLQHKKCLTTTKVNALESMNGLHCMFCHNQEKIKSFKETLNDKLNNEYILYGKYENDDAVFELVHKKCNHRFETTHTRLLKGDTCPNCSDDLKNLTYKETIFKLVGDEYEVISNYLDSKSQVTYLHSFCGTKFTEMPNKFRVGYRCPNCRENTKLEAYKAEVRNLVNDEYEVLGEYVSSTDEIEMSHKTCGKSYKTTPQQFKNSTTRCPECSFSEAKLKFESYFDAKYKNEFLRLTEFKSNSKAIDLKHTSCNREFSIIPNKVKNGIVCPRCSSSKGENKVAEVLLKYKILFKEQVPINVGEKTLYVDFVIYDTSQNVKHYIEFDGEQHFTHVEYFQTYDDFKKQRYNDTLKDNYAKTNNIPILRIPYYDFNDIEDILKSHLNIN